MQKNTPYIIGVDEVGRGAWAGPVTVCAFCFLSDCPDIEQLLADSKVLSKKKREYISSILLELKKEERVDFEIVDISPRVIEKINIRQATRKGMNKAIRMLIKRQKNTEFYIQIDGNDNFSFRGLQASYIIKWDTKVREIQAGSILAKVHRDAKMGKYSKRYIWYGFEKHVGYGTKQHQEALQKKGIVAIHRKTYRPIKLTR